MMARRSTGGVVVDTRGASPTYSIRFRAYGDRRFVRLGSVAEGWTQAKAEKELRHVLADVERGVWQPKKPEKVAADPLPEDPTFHEFASQWFRDNEAGWKPATRIDYQWQLSNHLLPTFAGHRLSQITIREVDRYRATKVADKDPETGRSRLCPASINKTITRLSQILEVAVEYKLIDHNPAKGKRRRLKAPKPTPVWLDTAAQMRALLDAAGELDRGARRDRQHIQRRAILATLLLAGLRLGEMLDLRWRDVDLSAGRLTVREAKTAAGTRQVDIFPTLAVELGKLQRGAPDERAFATSGEKERHTPSNIRRRVLAPAVTRANEQLALSGEAPLPAPLTPHKLRHTFASMLAQLGEDPGSMMDQLGHTDPTFTFRVYRHAMRRDPAAKEALREFVGLDRAATSGSNVLEVAFGAPENLRKSSTPGRI